MRFYGQLMTTGGYSAPGEAPALGRLASAADIRAARPWEVSPRVAHVTAAVQIIPPPRTDDDVPFLAPADGPEPAAPEPAPKAKVRADHRSAESGKARSIMKKYGVTWGEPNGVRAWAIREQGRHPQELVTYRVDLDVLQQWVDAHPERLLVGQYARQRRRPGRDRRRGATV